MPRRGLLVPARERALATAIFDSQLEFSNVNGRRDRLFFFSRSSISDGVGAFLSDAVGRWPIRLFTVFYREPERRSGMTPDESDHIRKAAGAGRRSACAPARCSASAEHPQNLGLTIGFACIR